MPCRVALTPGWRDAFAVFPVPVRTASSVEMSEPEQRELQRIEHAIAPLAWEAAADLVATIALGAPLLAAWTDRELAEGDAEVPRALASWLSWGLPPRMRERGETPHAYARALLQASIATTSAPAWPLLRRFGRTLRRFARAPELAPMLARSRASGVLASPELPTIVRVLDVLDVHDPRNEEQTGNEAGEIDWDAEDKRARDERAALEASTRKGFYERMAAAGSAYAAASTAFPALLVAAPALAIAFAAGAALFEGFMGVSKLFGGGDANSQEQRDRVARDLGWWLGKGLPAVVFDGELWSARGYADLLEKLQARYQGWPLDIRGTLDDLGRTIRDNSQSSAVAQAAIDTIARGATGYGPFWGPAFRSPGSNVDTIAGRLGQAVARLLAVDYERRGYASPEARMTSAATDAYRGALLDKSIATDDVHGVALARAFDAATTAAKPRLVALPRVETLTLPVGMFRPAGTSSPSSSSAIASSPWGAPTPTSGATGSTPLASSSSSSSGGGGAALALAAVAALALGGLK